MVYVFCGQKGFSPLSSIESLSVDAFEKKKKMKWKLIKPKDGKTIFPRYNPVVVAINDTQILIMGG